MQQVYAKRGDMHRLLNAGPQKLRKRRSSVTTFLPLQQAFRTDQGHASELQNCLASPSIDGLSMEVTLTPRPLFTAVKYLHGLNRRFLFQPPGHFPAQSAAAWGLCWE